MHSLQLVLLHLSWLHATRPVTVTAVTIPSDVGPRLLVRLYITPNALHPLNVGLSWLLLVHLESLLVCLKTSPQAPSSAPGLPSPIISPTSGQPEAQLASHAGSSPGADLEGDLNVDGNGMYTQVIRLKITCLLLAETTYFYGNIKVLYGQASTIP